MRIVVIGTPGAGKTTLARRIAGQLGLPHIELDAINWQPGWRDLARHDPALFVSRVVEAIQAEAWVADGKLRSGARPAMAARHASCLARLLAPGDHTPGHRPFAAAGRNENRAVGGQP